MSSYRPFAIVTGASTGIGYELAKCCVWRGFDLIVAADEPAIHEAAREFGGLGAAVTAVETDLATIEVSTGCTGRFRGGRLTHCLRNAGHGLGKGFWIKISTMFAMSSIRT